ncbi:MAG: hypothetical protein JNK38_08605 [Acidobacteria bacterium]|nr:hypothetical protein [Acidobacteriota bacterium]
MSSVERLLQEARTLPTNEQMILASLLIQQAQHPVSIDEDRQAAFHRVRGSLAGLLPTTEEFMAEKRAELDQEEERFLARFGCQTKGVQ